MGNESYFAHKKKIAGAKGKDCPWKVFSTMLEANVTALFSGRCKDDAGLNFLAFELREKIGTSSMVPTKVLENLSREGERMSSNSAERRRSPRLHLQIPIFVRGVDAHGDGFLDLSRTVNISATGACLAVPRPMKPGELISLTIPAPPPTASGLVPAETPPLQGRIRRMQPVGDVHLIGVEFTRVLE
jgi:hypothetical protein